jgi:carboxypeptidase C (cathepsin A)
VRKVARYSGLDPAFIERANLRVSDQRFRKELLRDRGVHIGRLDGRYTGVDADAAGEDQEYDPSNQALGGPYTALFLDYVRRELKWESELPYYTSGQVQPWDYAPYSNRYLNMVEDLRSAMARNPYLKVMVANGYYDFATPFAATEYTFDHLGMEPSYRERVSLTLLRGGARRCISIRRCSSSSSATSRRSSRRRGAGRRRTTEGARTPASPRHFVRA